MVQTNRLTELLVLKELTVSATTYGEAIEIYRPIKALYASITTQRGDRNFTAPGAVYTDSISFYTRFFDVSDKKKLRVEYNGDDYVIENITTVQRNKATILECKSVK